MGQPLCVLCHAVQPGFSMDALPESPAGMHVLDVSPYSFKHLPGWEEAMAERETVRMLKVRHASQSGGLCGLWLINTCVCSVQLVCAGLSCLCMPCKGIVVSIMMHRLQTGLPA